MKDVSKPKLIIFEGIATSGKTTTISNLISHLQEKHQITFVSEEETTVPLFENRDPLKAVEYLKNVIENIKKISTSYIIVERLFITHAFRTNSKLNIFSGLENEVLNCFDPITILLRMQDDYISNRIELADKQRGATWKHKKVGTLEERVNYYIEQQKYLKKLFSESAMPIFSIDTSRMDWDNVLNIILKNI
ncbi:MAG: hypothetical protein WCV83_01895 [Candidatus Magasanikbacteria bacterium]